MRRFLLAIVALLAVTGFGSAALAAYPAFTPTGEHFSIPFPPNPTETDASPDVNPIRQWTAKDGDFLYITSQVVSSGGAFAESQLTADMNDFIKGTNATILSEESVSWPSPDGAARALLFTFRLTNGLLGRGVFVLDRSLGFSAGIVDLHQGEDSPYMVEYVNALTILP